MRVGIQMVEKKKGRAEESGEKYGVKNGKGERTAGFRNRNSALLLQ